MQFSNIVSGLETASPYIAFGIGVVGVVGAVVSAVRFGMNIGEIIDDYNTEKEELDLYLENQLEDGAVSEDVPVESIQKNHDIEVHKLQLRTFGRIARLGAPVAACTALSLGGFGFSVGKLRGKYLMASGLATSVIERFDAYRESVREEYGEDVDNALYYGLKKEKITVEEKDPETGKTKKVKKDILTGVPEGEFTRRWERYDWQTHKGSTQWDQSNIYNKNYVLMKLTYYQNNLDAGKKVMFDKVLDELGYENDIKATDHIAGWEPGDIIDFGLGDDSYEKYQDVRDFMDDISKEVTLRFNCRRDVLGLLPIIKKPAQDTYIEGDNGIGIGAEVMA